LPGEDDAAPFGMGAGGWVGGEEEDRASPSGIGVGVGGGEEDEEERVARVVEEAVREAEIELRGGVRRPRGY